MDYQCKQCGYYGWLDNHKCYQFTVEYDGEVSTVWAMCIDEAAEKFVKQYEQDDTDYPVASGRYSMTVTVAQVDKDLSGTFDVSGEFHAVYQASERG